MTNHVHLLVSPSDEKGISRMMQVSGRKYVQYFNFPYGRTGTLWEGRYKSTLVDADNYLLTVYRYIELNPVRVGMVSHTSEYPWSSYQGNALGKRIELLTPHNTIASWVRATRRGRLLTVAFFLDGCLSGMCPRYVKRRTNHGFLVMIGSRHKLKQQLDDVLCRRVEEGIGSQQCFGKPIINDSDPIDRDPIDRKPRSKP